LVAAATLGLGLPLGAAAATTATTAIAAVGVPASPATCAAARPQLTLSAPRVWGPDTVHNLHVDGEVHNVGPTDAETVQVAYTLLDAAGRSLLSSTVLTQSAVVAAGEVAGFDARVIDAPRGVVSARLDGVTGLPALRVPLTAFPLTVTTASHQGGGQPGRLAGTAVNGTSTPVISVVELATFYDAGGQVAFVMSTSTSDRPDSLQPGQSEPWIMNLDAAAPAWTTYHLIARADSPGTRATTAATRCGTVTTAPEPSLPLHPSEAGPVYAPLRAGGQHVALAPAVPAGTPRTSPSPAASPGAGGTTPAAAALLPSAGSEPDGLTLRTAAIWTGLAFLLLLVGVVVNGLRQTPEEKEPRPS
jgi:hypothetical protein